MAVGEGWGGRLHGSTVFFRLHRYQTRTHRQRVATLSLTRTAAAHTQRRCSSPPTHPSLHVMQIHTVGGGGGRWQSRTLALQGALTAPHTCTCTHAAGPETCAVLILLPLLSPAGGGPLEPCRGVRAAGAAARRHGPGRRVVAAGRRAGGHRMYCMPSADCNLHSWSPAAAVTS